MAGKVAGSVDRRPAGDRAPCKPPAVFGCPPVHAREQKPHFLLGVLLKYCCHLHGSLPARLWLTPTTLPCFCIPWKACQYFETNMCTKYHLCHVALAFDSVKMYFFFLWSKMQRLCLVQGSYLGFTLSVPKYNYSID